MNDFAWRAPFAFYGNGRWYHAVGAKAVPQKPDMINPIEQWNNCARLKFGATRTSCNCVALTVIHRTSNADRVPVPMELARASF
jgi:hypothetical protein